MIIKETMYMIECDRCVKTLQETDDELTVFTTQNEAMEAALADGWVFNEEKCVCAECMTEVIAKSII